MSRPAHLERRSFLAMLFGTTAAYAARRLNRGPVPPAAGIGSLTISGTPATTGTVGAAYNLTPTVGGAVGGATFSLTGSVGSSGLSLNTSTGVFSATTLGPAATYGPFVITVTDGLLRTASLASFSVVVSAAGVIAAALPHANWTGDPLSGYTGGVAPVTPTAPQTGAVSARPMPTAKWFTVPKQAFCDDFTVHVFAGAPNGIQSVEFFHENPTTTTVTAPQHNTVVNGALPLAIQYSTFAITLPASAWCNDATKGGGTKQGATLYAKVTPNPVSGVTLFPRIIGPLNLCPRYPTLGQAHDKIVWISSDGKDDAGATLINPNSSVYTIVNTINQAEALIGTGGAYASAFNPAVVFKRSGTYTFTNQRGYGTFSNAPFAPCFWTLTHDPGVTVTIAAASTPSYDHGAGGASDYAHWYWYMMRGQAEFRGTGITFNHKDFAGFGTDSIPGYWDNQCKHTLVGVTSITDPTSGISSPMYNIYWNAGPHPGFNLAPNGFQQDYGVVGTGATYEYVLAHAGGGDGSNLNIECKYRDPRGGIGSNKSIIGSYMRGSMTGLFDPGLGNLFTIQGPAGSTIDFTGSNDRGFHTTLVLYDGNAGSPVSITIGNGPSEANYTAAQLATTVNGRAGWTLTPGAAATFGFSAQWAMPENGTPPGGISVASAVILDAKQPIHTEWMHMDGQSTYSVAGSHRIDNLLLMNNVCRRPTHWGSATIQAESTGTPTIDRPDNSYIVNNIFEDDHNGIMRAMTGGSFNTVSNNSHDIQESWDAGLNGTDGTRWAFNISSSLSGTPALNGTIVDHNMTPTGAPTHALDATNTDLSSTQITNLYVDAVNGDYRAGGSSVIPSHQGVSPEPYDLFGNLRDPAGDYPGALSKNSQAAAHAWPF